MTTSTPEGDPPDLLDRLTVLGPFFALNTHDPHTPARPPWRALSDLIDDPDLLRARVDDARDHLAAASGRPRRTVELRVAASVVHLGIAARLISPALAVAALADLTPPFALASLRWQNVLGGAFPMSIPHQQLQPSPDTRPAHDQWPAMLIDGPIRQLVQATAALSVSPRILWGNVASAASGAVSVLASAGPDVAQRSRGLAALLTSHPSLRGAGHGEPGTATFRRQTCCLIYRIAGTARHTRLCGDCVLRNRVEGPTQTAE